MGRLHSQNDRCINLVKALPHRSNNYFETVCCAGIGEDRQWRRQYPVPHAVFKEAKQFGRWDWIDYDFTEPRNDRRVESQKVVPESIEVNGSIKLSERASFLEPIIRGGPSEAEGRGESLSLVRPKRVDFYWRKKPQKQLEKEAEKHRALASQFSLLDGPVDPFVPSPYSFHFKWESQTDGSHDYTCDDWETTTAFFRRRRVHGEEGALQSLKETYEDQYFKRGMVFAIGTHSRRTWQWLLVGVLRVDQTAQTTLL